MRQDIGRVLVGLVLVAPLLAAWAWSIWDESLLPGWSHLLLLAGYLLALVLNMWWFPSIKLREKAPIE